MKKILLVFLLLVPLAVFAPSEKVFYLASPSVVRPYDKIMDAVGAIESGGDTMAYNPREHAHGIYQIRPIRLRDYNERTGKDYKLTDLYTMAVSREIFLYYARSIGPNDLERIIRNWNGSGKKTYEYLKKVKSRL
jgi:hypothetical protein